MSQTRTALEISREEIRSKEQRRRIGLLVCVVAGVTFTLHSGIEIFRKKKDREQITGADIAKFAAPTVAALGYIYRERIKNLFKRAPIIETTPTKERHQLRNRSASDTGTFRPLAYSSSQSNNNISDSANTYESADDNKDKNPSDNIEDSPVVKTIKRKNLPTVIAETKSTNDSGSSSKSSIDDIFPYEIVIQKKEGSEKTYLDDVRNDNARERMAGLIKKPLMVDRCKAQDGFKQLKPSTDNRFELKLAGYEARMFFALDVVKKKLICYSVSNSKGLSEPAIPHALKVQISKSSETKFK